MNNSSTKIQWFPGHMTKTLRMIEADLKNVDVVIEIIDARLPKSSRNPMIEELVKNKKRLVLMNKSDLADSEASKKWVQYFKLQGYDALMINATTGKGIKEIPVALRSLLSEKIERDKQKGMNKAVRAMVLGIPNVGKSSFINRISGTAKTRVADRPGVTRGKQWIRFEGVDLLDTPGVLWHKFDDAEVALNLAYTGAIKDDVYDVEQVAQSLAEWLSKFATKGLETRYKLSEADGQSGTELLTQIAKKRGFLISGGELDTERAAYILLDEFRAGLLGRITLELPAQI